MPLFYGIILLVQKLVDYFISGCKEEKSFSLGFELEHFVVDKKTKETACFSTIESILKKLAPFYETKIFEKERLVGLKREKALISLEPAGQLELSIGEFINIKDFEKEYSKFNREISSILEKENLILVTEGYQPKSKAYELQLIPKARYKIMDEYFKHTGTMGKNMMRGTAATHISIDYSSEADAQNKFRLATILSPIFAYIFYNTIYFEGEKAPPLTKVKIWENVDNDRSMFAKSSTCDFSFLGYATLIGNNCPILVKKNGGFVPTKKKVNELFDDSISVCEIEHILSLFFYFVRLKNYIEIRIADSVPIEKALGYIALIKGIFYNKNNLSYFLEKFSFVCESDVYLALEALKNSGEIIYSNSIKDLVAELLEKASAGLCESEKEFLCRI